MDSFRATTWWNGRSTIPPIQNICQMWQGMKKDLRSFVPSWREYLLIGRSSAKTYLFHRSFLANFAVHVSSVQLERSCLTVRVTPAGVSIMVWTSGVGHHVGWSLTFCCFVVWFRHKRTKFLVLFGDGTGRAGPEKMPGPAQRNPFNTDELQMCCRQLKVFRVILSSCAFQICYKFVCCSRPQIVPARFMVERCQAVIFSSIEILLLFIARLPSRLTAWNQGSLYLRQSQTYCCVQINQRSELYCVRFLCNRLYLNDYTKAKQFSRLFFVP